MSVIKKLYALLCGPLLLHVLLPVIMLYLVAGTVAQKYIGLYKATQIFFAAPVLWAGPVPLPGLPVLLGLLFLNMSCKLAFKSPWHIRNAGMILTHTGLLFLLLGGLFTALFSHEGYIALGRGEQKNIVSDYHDRAFVVMDENGAALLRLDHKKITENRTVAPDGLPFSLHILETCQNCAIVARQDKTENHKGMAQHMQLTPAPLQHNDEENMAGVTFQVVRGRGDDMEGIFTVLEDVPKYPEIFIDGKTYKVALRRAQANLPFSVELLDFKKELYPGTDNARAYQSTVRIQDGAMEWESVISMNAPLRYKGYTFYQSSFFQTPQGEVSVLAVVWNAGRAFPYIAGVTMCIGLLLHLFLRRKCQTGIM